MTDNYDMVLVTDVAGPSTSKEVQHPCTEIQNPSKDVQSPPKEAHSPSKEVQNQFKELLSPSKEVQSPSKEAHSPSKEVQNQFKELLSPSKEVQSPSKEVQSPSKEVPRPCPPEFKMPAMKPLFSDKLNRILIEKRKAISEDVSAPGKRMRRTEVVATLASVKSEARRLKIELIATKAQVVKLESQVNKERGKCMEMQILFEEEKGCLIAQHKRDERIVSDMADKMEMIKWRERYLREDYDQEKSEHKQYKAKWDQQKFELQKTVAELKNKLLECSSSSQQQISEMRKDMDELMLGLSSAQSEIEILKPELERQTETARHCTDLTIKLEKQGFELQIVNMELKKLEYEKASYVDWMQQAKTAERRLIRMAELETAVTSLRQRERNLRDLIGNKLLLEEQVHVLESKLNATLPMQTQLHEAMVKVGTLELALEEWRAPARAHGIESANVLGSTLDTVLSNQLDATIEASEAQLRLTQVTEEMEMLKFELKKATGKVNELLLVRKHNEALIERLQKKLRLITYDRDSYRDLLTSYEKELSMIFKEEEGSNSSELLNRRIEQQEESLQRYRDLLIQHDPTEQTKLVESLRTEAGKLREENEFLNDEVERLRRHRNGLLVHLERIARHS